MQQDQCQLRSRELAKLLVMPLLKHTLSLIRKKYRQQSKSRLWSSEITIVPKSKYYRAQHSKILQLIWSHSWKELDQREVWATRHYRCCSNPSTGRRRLTKSSWLETQPQIPKAMLKKKERIEVQTIGIQADFQLLTLTSRLLCSPVRNAQCTLSTWTMEQDSTK